MKKSLKFNLIPCAVAIVDIEEDSRTFLNYYRNL